MKERSRSDSDRASMSGGMLAFVAVMGFIVCFFVTLIAFPKAFNFVWYGSLTLVYNTFMWVWSPEFVLLLCVLVGLVVAINVLIWLKKLYVYLFTRDTPEKTREGWNEYRIK